MLTNAHDTLLHAVSDRHRQSLFNASQDTPYQQAVLHEDLLYVIWRRRCLCWQSHNARRSFARHRKAALERDLELFFLEALEEHANSFCYEVGFDGFIRTCRKCGDPIRGTVCFNRAHQALHWGCKQECQVGEIVSGDFDENPSSEELFARRVQHRRRQHILRGPVQNNPIISYPEQCCSSRALRQDAKMSTTLRKSFYVRVADRDMKIAGCQERCISHLQHF